MDPAEATDEEIEAVFAQMERRRVEGLRNEKTEAFKEEVEANEKEVEASEKEREKLRAEEKARMAEIEKLAMEREHEDEDRREFQRRTGLGISFFIR